MKFSSQNTGKVFYFPGQEDVNQKDKAWIRMRPMSNDMVRKIVKSATSIQIDLKSVAGDDKLHQVQWEEHDHDLIYEETWDYCIMDWGNVEVDDRPVECNKENKLMLLGNDVFFFKCATEYRSELEKDLEALADIERKNS